jgi:hypothetical protein
LRVLLEPTRSNSPCCRTRRKFGLQIDGEIADLVEKQGPSIGQLKTPDPCRGGSRKGAALVSEELALDE